MTQSTQTSANAPLTPATSASAPAVTIVVAVWGSLSALAECLQTLGIQRDEATQVVVVTTVPLPHGLRQLYPWFELIEAPTSLLIPHLWAIGMARAINPIVAITTAHFVPAADYLCALRQAHGRLDAAGIGGTIEPHLDGDSVTWATYFLRYSTYLGWRTERTVVDFAGDNGSYKRAALPASLHHTRQGFWEQRIHRELIVAGQCLAFVPEIRITQHASFGFRRFCRQRFQHGVEFGRERVETAAVAGRLLRIASAPAIPFVLLGKVVARVIRARRYVGPFVRSLPVLILFVLAWAMGETFGYLTGAKSAAVASSRVRPSGA